MKQIEMVLDAVCDGFRHSAVIAEATGLRIATVSAYLTELVRMDAIRRTGSVVLPRGDNDGRVRRLNVYSPTTTFAQRHVLASAKESSRANVEDVA